MSDTIDLADAVALAHAVASRIADDVGARALFIKGPSAELLGLRVRRISSDVDVWIEPSRFREVVDALLSLGWTVRPSRTSPRVLEAHSITLFHRSWPCDIDVHHFYPGFFAPPDVVFDALWNRRVEVNLAEQRLFCPDPAGMAAVIALHGLRDLDVRRNVDELQFLASILSAPENTAMREGFVEVVHQTGAAFAIAPFLEQLGIDPTSVTGAWDGDEDSRRAWRVRVASNSVTVAWMLEFQRYPLKRWPAMAARMLVPSYEDLRSVDPSLPRTARALAQARVSRLARGLRDLPRSVAVLREGRTNR